jgi:hypothetical protein
MDEHTRISKEQTDEASKRQTKRPSEQKKVENQTKGK